MILVTFLGVGLGSGWVGSQMLLKLRNIHPQSYYQLKYCLTQPNIFGHFVGGGWGLGWGGGVQLLKRKNSIYLVVLDSNVNEWGFVRLPEVAHSFQCTHGTLVVVVVVPVPVLLTSGWLSLPGMSSLQQDVLLCAGLLWGLSCSCKLLFWLESPCPCTAGQLGYCTHF